MKNIFFISFILFFFTKSISSYTFLAKKPLQEAEEKYPKLSAISIKAFIPKSNVYIIDTRNNTVSNLGYLQNSLLLPLTMSYSTWFPAVIKEGSNIVLICDKTNFKDAIEQTESLGPYNILGYAIYDELIKEYKFEIQVAEYNENTKEDVEKLVENYEYLLDIREKNEYIETGVIEQSNLIPLSTFKTDYVNIPEDVDVYVFCKGGGRALLGMSFMKRAGYTNKFIIMKGGMSKTINSGYPLVPYSE